MTHLPKSAPARVMRWLAPALLLAGAMALSACSGGSDASDPPPAAAPLGDPVTQTVGTAGGTVQATTLDAKLKLVFPAGALAADTAVTITPVTPATGDVVSVKLRPAGVFFAKPVTVVLEYPPGKAPAASARLRLRLGGADSYIGTTVDSAARTLTATLNTFGGSTVQALAEPAQDRARALSARPLDIPADGDGTLAASELSTVALAVANARARLSLLTEAGFFEDALALQRDIADLLQRTGEDGYIAEAVPFLNQAHDTACILRALAIDAARNAPLRAPGDFQPLFSKLMHWDAVVQRLGGELCRGDTTGAAANDAAHALALRQADFLRVQLPAATTPAQFTPPAGDVKAARRLKAQAGQLQATDPNALPLSAGEARPLSMRPASAALNLSDMRTALQADLIDPSLEPARRAAWTSARSGGALGQYPTLIDAFGGAGPLAQDAQYVRTRIAVASSDSSGNPVGDATLGFSAVPELPADPMRSATVQIRSGGTLALSGNVATLECATAGSETLQVTFENVQVRSVSGSGGNLLAGALASLTPAGLLQAAGLPDTDTGVHPLVIKRTSPCSAALGITDEVIGTVMVDFGAPPFRFGVDGAQVVSLIGLIAQGGCYWVSSPMVAQAGPWSQAYGSHCGFDASLDFRLADSHTLTVSSEYNSPAVTQSSIRLFLWLEFDAAGTVTASVDPAWMRTFSCGLYPEIRRSFVLVTANLSPGGMVGTSPCPQQSFPATTSVTFQVTAGQRVVIDFTISSGQPYTPPDQPATSLNGSGKAMTLHFEPTH
jgi:hypothetical protein